ncbi:unnamed protein product [Diamesa hyperborea]
MYFKDFVGGASNVDFNDESLNLFMNEALAEINSTEVKKYEVVKILQAKKQIVSGVLYTFRVALKKDAADVICLFEVWEQAWRFNGRDVDVKCNNQNVYKLTQNPDTTDFIVGGKKQIQRNNPYAMNLLTNNLPRLFIEGDEKFKLITVDKITKQVVAGMSYNIIGLFNVGNEGLKNCTISIWERVWLESSDKLIINAQCDDETCYSTNDRPKD